MCAAADRIGASNDVRLTIGKRFDLFEGDRRGNRRFDVPDLRHVAEHFTAEAVRKELLRDRASRDARHGFTSAASAASAIIAATEFCVERVVGVPRPVHVLDVAVVA